MRVEGRRFALATACAVSLGALLVASACTRLPGVQPSLPSIQLPTVSGSPSPGAAPISEDAILERSRNAIIRIEGVDCEGSYRTGSGFFVQPGFVLTAYHVVADQQSLAVRTLSTRDGAVHVFPADVIGQNQAADVALLQVADERADSLSISSADPAVNTPIVSIGYPKGLPIDLETGRITGVDQDGVVQDGDDRRALEGVLRFTAPASGGNSGGPLIDQTGTVVGMVDTGYADSQVHYAVPGKIVKALAEGWSASPETQPPPPCESPSQGPAGELEVKTGHADAPGIGTAVEAYFGGITAGDEVVDDESQLTGFELAYRQLSGERLATYPTLEKFRDAHRQRISDVVLQSVSYVDDTTDKVRLAYDYVTIGTDGSPTACRRRSMEYSMSIATGVWTFAEQEVRRRVAC